MNKHLESRMISNRCQRHKLDKVETRQVVYLMEVVIAMSRKVPLDIVNSET